MSSLNEKSIFWAVFFTEFLALQLYEAIVAILWQSASYVIRFVHFVGFF